LSKDLTGELRLVESQRERCLDRECITLETVNQLDLDVARHDCDSEVGGLLDGRLHSGDLTHKFEDGDGTRRGIHEGTFRWQGVGALAVGTLQGVTNVGTHRQPAFDDCQRCDTTGVMEGLLRGTIRRARDRRLIGCGLQAAYRLRFDPTAKGPQGGVRGTLEGDVVCNCAGQPPRTCIEFSALPIGAGPNPLVEQGVSFNIFDGSGSPAASSSIRTQGSFTGLDVGFRTEVKLPVRCAAVEATLVTLAAPATLEAFNSDGTSAGTASMSGPQNVAETLRITGTSIDSAIIHANGEALLLRFCFEPLPG
jgi:hypothetical protein